MIQVHVYHTNVTMYITQTLQSGTHKRPFVNKGPHYVIPVNAFFYPLYDFRSLSNYNLTVILNIEIIRKKFKTCKRTVIHYPRRRLCLTHQYCCN